MGMKTTIEAGEVVVFEIGEAQPGDRITITPERDKGGKYRRHSIEMADSVKYEKRAVVENH